MINHSTHRATPPTRRLFLGGTLLLLGGCAGSGETGRGAVAQLPGPIWDPSPAPHTPSPMPSTSGVISRTAWAGAAPIPARMDSMTPIRRITIHHDGMSPFTQTSADATRARLESIRRAHVQRRPQAFGDIGYHYAIDPAGRIWAGRPIRYQGAHVRAQNEGNLGIVVLGNYDQQGLNETQKRAIIAFVGSQMRSKSIRSSHVATHQELAATACPGRSLQAFMITARNGRLA